jgi:hypothetical protein
MATVLGIWFALAGVLPVVVGLAGLRRVRRLRRDGATSWAVALQYRLADGRVLEKPASAATSKALRPGQSVLVWYDPEDPMDVLVYGREGRLSDLMFVAAGAALVLAGVGIAVFAP